ncbi:MULTISPECIES: HNH/ENDO VII family nuclease [unclassified Streptomyces]|uniref:HNH/ENDO VII family nuclease n=1 Tax=unclassified Streptomyces TaxID=2593676 RepID=UPI002E0E46D5|nr:HNH/ENDO VII family nuclease [Streptomyces sp. NBC_01197]WSS51685.1 HNH/ENDO VII family nuclease [Streptomyces sp. NBC_01180]
MVTSVVALAVLGGLTVRPDLLDLGRGAESASDSYDWYEDTAAEKLRQDQCLMGDVLRLGGPSMAKTAQGGLNQAPDQLRVLADRQYWQKTPLATAYTADRDAAGKDLKRMQQGLAPMGPDDMPLNLHHMLQTQDGPMAEVTKKMHLDENYHQLHWKSGSKIPSGIDRPEFDKWKKLYWKDRAKGFSP